MWLLLFSIFFFVNAQKCCIESSTKWGKLCVQPNTSVVFREYALCERGTTWALFDYADYWEKIACGKAWISSEDSNTICSHRYTTTHSAYPVFAERFGSDRMFVTDEHWINVDDDIAGKNISMIYQLSWGERSSTKFHPQNTRQAIHAVFVATEPHGDVYAAVSPEIPQSPGIPVVLHIVRPANLKAKDLRDELEIPQNATVFCRHGGPESFDIPFVKERLCEKFQTDKTFDRPWVLFLNTNDLGCEEAARKYGRVRFLEGTTDRDFVGRFLKTCDVCIHARTSGETFGLAVAECSSFGLPVLTSGIPGHDGNYHLKTLGEHALLYYSGNDFISLITNFSKTTHAEKKNIYMHLYDDSLPEAVMISFIKTFLPQIIL